MAALPGSGGDVLGWAFGDELRYFSEVCGEGLLTRDGDELVDVRVYCFSIGISINRSFALTAGYDGDSATLSDCAMRSIHCLPPSTSTRPPGYLPSIPLLFLTMPAALIAIACGRVLQQDSCGFFSHLAERWLLRSRCLSGYFLTPRAPSKRLVLPPCRPCHETRVRPSLSLKAYEKPRPAPATIE